MRARDIRNFTKIKSNKINRAEMRDIFIPLDRLVSQTFYKSE